TETPPAEDLRLPARTVKLIVSTFRRLFAVYRNAALEFGVLRKKDEDHVYLIDVAEADANTNVLNHSLLLSGVVSSGDCTGSILTVNQSDNNSLDLHLHDVIHEKRGEGRATIIYARRAS